MRSVFRGVILGLVGLLVTGEVANTQVVTFSGPPETGDRQIAWEWDPIPGLDPFFRGNTVLETVEDGIPIPVPGRLRLLRSNVNGSLLYGVGELTDQIYVFHPDSGLIRTLPAPPSRLSDLDIHRSHEIILGGLEDGRVARWDLREDAPEELSLFFAHSVSCDHVRFLIDASDPNEQRFVSAGEEDTVRVWTQPGELLTEITTPGSITSSIALTTSGSRLAIGDQLGSIRIFEPLGGTRLDRVDGREAPVVAMEFANDLGSLISLDSDGWLFGWDAKRWGSELFSTQVDSPDGLLLGIRQPDAALAYTLDQDGRLEVRDGSDGRIYRSVDLVEEGARFGSAIDGLGRQIFLGLGDERLRIFRTGFCSPSESDPECFGGYKLWRSETPFDEDAILLRVFGFGDSTWSFQGDVRSFVDPDSLIARGGDLDAPLAGPHNGLPYYYSITAFERRYLNGSVFDVQLNSIEEGFFRHDPEGNPTSVRAHQSDRTDLPLLGKVFVVPNPYEAGRVPWDRELGPHVDFRNLPERATIDIYTVGGDLMRTIEHGPGDFGEATDTRSWDMRNDQGKEITSGVYIYHVTTPISSEETKGYFVVVR